MPMPNPRFDVEVKQHYTDPDELVGRGGVVRYLPTATLRAISVTITDTLSGAVTTFHGRHDGDTPLYEWRKGGDVEAFSALVEYANRAAAAERVEAGQ